MTKFKKLTIYKNHFNYNLPIYIFNQNFSLILARNNPYYQSFQMYSSSQSVSSDILSYGSHKQTNLSKFISIITPQFLNDMKRFLQQNKFFYEHNQHDASRISLYEDIYAIVTIKQNQQQIFYEKGKLKNTIQQIATFTKRKYITIDERLRKKLSNLTQDQIRYCMTNKKDLIFEQHTKKLVTKDWPTHLRNVNINNRINEQNVICLDSSSQNIIERKPNKTIVLTKRTDKKSQIIPNNFNKFQRSINKSQKYDHQDIEKQQIKHSDDFNGLNFSKNLNMNNIIDRGVFSEKVIQNWQRKYQPNLFEATQFNLENSHINYNFKTRQFIYINPLLVKDLLVELAKEQQLYTVRSKTKNKINNRQPENINGKYQNRNIHTKPQNSQSEIQEKSTRKKIQISNKRNSLHNPQSMVVNIDGSGQIEQNKDDIKKKIPKVQDLIRTIQDVANNVNINQLNQQTRQMIKQALKYTEQAKKTLSNKTYDRNQQTNKQTKKPTIFSLLSSQDQDQQNQEERQNQNKQNNKNQRNMLYWFNNDEQLYKQYQQDPYNLGYLMWSDDQDEIIIKANQDLNRFADEFQKLLTNKPAIIIKDRYQFLNIELSPQMEQYLEMII